MWRPIMKKLQVLGPGCARCEKLAEHTKTAADELGIDYKLEKITDITQITSFGIMMTPALAVDGVVKSSGKVPSVGELKELIQ